MGFVRIVDAQVEKPGFDDVVAVRCPQHAGIAPRIDKDADGNYKLPAECAICFAQSFGEMMAYRVSAEEQRRVLYPVLEAFANYMSHHALLRTRLDVAVGRLNLAQPGAGDALVVEWEVLDSRGDNTAAAFAAEEAGGKDNG